MIVRSFFLLLSLTFFAANARAVRAPVQKTEVNPLLAPWTGKYGGLPPFDRVQVKDFKPALETAMNEYRTEIVAIADNTAPATFDNTIVALEKAGRTFSRVNAIFGIWSSNMSSPEFQKVEQEMAPVLAAFQDEIVQNAKLFKRIETVDQSEEKAKLNPEQKRLLWLDMNNFVLQGARLNAEQKARVKEINQRLAALSTQFSQNLLGDEETDALVIDKESDLAGLPQSLIDAAAAEGERRNQKGHWIISNTRSSMEPFLTYAENRALREKAFRIWSSRGDQSNSHNNNKIVAETLKLRTERAKILGYPTYAHWHLVDSMAKDPKAAMDLMMKVWQPAVAAVKKEVADMQSIVDAEHGGFKIQPWDYRYYMERVRRAKYDLDFNQVKPYLQLDNIREAMFWMAKELYGLKFVKLNDVPVYYKTVSVYKVLGKNGKQVGLWYFDPYARAGKNSGAWMNAYREQYRLKGQAPVTTIVSNNANFIQGKPGEPVLISWDDAVTMFHEFGHALHGLNSDVTYPSLSGTNVPRDYVEFPSQLHEHFVETPQVLRFLKNAKGVALPKELITKIEKAKTFNSGFTTVEFLASAIVDMKLHLATDKVDPASFEKKTLAELGMPSEIIMRHRIPQFGHLFSSEGYAAGYYGYLWAQVLDNDAYEAFTEAGNPYDKAVARRLHDDIMSVGNTIDPQTGYRQFRGRDAKIDALLRERGFPVPADTSVK